MSDHDEDRLRRLTAMEPLSETLSDRDGGELFDTDRVEAQRMAAQDDRFAELAAELAAGSLGARMQAIDRFFARLPAGELASMQLPPNLSQLRQIFLSSRAD